MVWSFLHKWASPKWFYQLTTPLIFWLGLFACCLLLAGIIWGLAFAPADYQQGNSFRIIYIHVPAALLAQSAYLFMALVAAIGLIWKIKLADMLAAACAPVGASFTVLALISGAIWGKPTWGTWWLWDARLTSMLILLFLYLGFIALQNAIRTPALAAKAAAILALAGLVNIPIIKYSVEWWYTLHQGPTFRLLEKPAMPVDMWLPLLIMVLGFYLFFVWVLLLGSRYQILTREAGKDWVKQLLLQKIT
jgi:heme exporter protein C